METETNPFLEPITNPVGTRIQLRGYTFEVVEEASCNGCFFNRLLQSPFCGRHSMYNDLARRGLTWEEAQSLGRCCKEYRTDKKSAIFKKIEES